MSIRIENISKSYGSFTALSDVSFTVEPGLITGFIGPNGAGKSSLMKIITGFLLPDKGNVFIEGVNIAQKPVEIRKHIGYLPENNPLYLHMYIKEYLGFVAGIYNLGKNRETRIRELIDQTGLGPEQNKRIGSLSKGYRQRVGIAQALLHNPRILILDEPTSGLDPNQIAEIRALISALGMNKTVMLSTHIMSEVEAICNRIIMINKGRIVADDTTAQLISGTKDSLQLLQVEFNLPVEQSRILSIRGVQDARLVSANQWLIAGSLNPDIRNELFTFAVNTGLVVLSMQRQEKSMEQVFRELTRE